MSEVNSKILQYLRAQSLRELELKKEETSLEDPWAGGLQSGAVWAKKIY